MTSQAVVRNHLKLVVGGGLRDVGEDEHSGHEQSVQLCLPFEDEHSVVLLHDSELLGPDAFSTFLEHVQPRWFLDVRVAPRMDFVAPTRALALRNLSARNIQYVDVLGRVNDASEWLTFVEKLLQRAHDTEGPYVILFDDRRTLQDARLHLPSFLHRIDAAEGLNVSTERHDPIAL